MAQSHEGLDRRSFLKSGLAAGTALTLAGPRTWGRSANETVGIGIIGFGWRGGQLAEAFSKDGTAKVVAVADPDRELADEASQKYGCRPYNDLRNLLENPEVDAVAVSTCNHWHCLAAIWALQAGKHVYVEKPLSHSQWEGRRVVEAAAHFGKVVQIGTQHRSDPMQAELKQFLHEERQLGAIRYAQANRLGPRASIGRRSTPLSIPKSVTYDLWLGPAQDEPLYRDKLHYDWHWDFNTGSGEMGNWGVHVLDDVRNVAYRDSVSTPRRIIALGGRIGWDDAGNTPNVHYAYFETDTFPTLIALSNLPARPDQDKPGWSTKAGRPASGPSTGYVVACEDGYLLGRRGGAKAIDRNGKTIREFQGGERVPNHVRNFLDAVRAGDPSQLNGGIEVGHHSSGWCNLANVAYQVGNGNARETARSINPDLDAWALLLEEMDRHLRAYDLDIASAQIKMSPVLDHDPAAERFVGDHAPLANTFLKRQYRSPYVVPETF